MDTVEQRVNILAAPYMTGTWLDDVCFSV